MQNQAPIYSHTNVNGTDPVAFAKNSSSPMPFPLVCENPGSANPVFATADHDDEKSKDYIDLKEY